MDCRRWWLYGPAKCQKMVQFGMRHGSHPDLAVYEDWPGYTKAFLASHFDDYDADKDGELTVEEFRVSSKTVKWGWDFYERHGATNAWTVSKADDMFRSAISHLSPFLKMAPKSGFEMCVTPSTFAAGGKTLSQLQNKMLKLHLFFRRLLNQPGNSHNSHTTATISKHFFINSILSKPSKSFCDYYDVRNMLA